MSGLASSGVDEAFYASTYGAELDGLRPEEHFRAIGKARGLLPNPETDPALEAFEAADAGEGPLLRRYDALCRAIIRHFPKPDYDGYFWTFLETHKPAAPGAAAPYDDARLRAPEASGHMAFEVAGTRREIRQPDTGAFLDTIAKGEAPVFHARLPHNFWDGMARVFILNRILAEQFPEAGLTGEARLRLAIRLARQLRPNDPQAILFLENFIPELKALAGALPADAPPALAFKAFPDGSAGLFGNNGLNPPRAPYIFDAVDWLLTGRTDFGDAMLMKRIVMCGEFSSFIDIVRARPVLLVANVHFADFAERFGLPAGLFVEIPPRESHRARQAVANRCREALAHVRQASPHAPPIVLTRCGGSFAFYLISRLRAEFSEASFVDLGQSINLWFLDREIIPRGALPWTPGLEKQVRLNRLGEFYRTRCGVPDISAFHIERHGTAAPARRWSPSSRFLQYAQLCAARGMDEEAELFIDRARAETPDDEALLRFIRQRRPERPPQS